MIVRVSMLSGATLLTACLSAMDAPSSNPAAGGASVDDAQILASVAGGAYRHGTRFVPVSAAAYPSAIAAQTSINVWVTAADYAAYTRISPDASGSGASLAPGAIIVREVLDASGAVAKVTLMAKGPPGYNPTVGDFWFGVTQPDGTPMVDQGTAEVGKVSACFGCHMPRASDGFLFGVPAADRAPSGSGSTPPAMDGGADGSADGGADGGAAPGDMGTCRGHGGKCGGDEQ
jgi:hypothetical protein